VDDLSSAHVYLRLKKGMDWKAIPPLILEECCQLVKENSIQGCKLNNIYIVYTPWSNLNKTKSMEVGQVGFKSEKDIRKVKVEKKIPEIIKRLEKTRIERIVDLESEHSLECVCAYVCMCVCVCVFMRVCAEW
jgi:hypothetical protein